MALETINPYLFFSGNAADAIAFYEKAIDARVVRVARFGDNPGSENLPPEAAAKVMHAHLQAGKSDLMLSDGMPGAVHQHGDGVFVCLQYEGRSDIDRHFAALAEGGTIAEPLRDTFWGARFGLLVDRFGVHWMFNATLTE